MTGAWPHLTATHRLHSQQVSAPGLLVPKQLHCGPEGLALGTQLRPRFPQELLQEPPVPGQLFQRLLQGPGQVRSTLCGALGRGGDRQGLGECPDFGGPELSGEGGWYTPGSGEEMKLRYSPRVRQTTFPQREMQGFSHPLYLDTERRRNTNNPS